ncbi:MAG TPA: hypothetical protein VFX96_07050 [Pyrinomonadaceae bacterium]|nr:hypothetical protein [Pyrinomonadaceae bacterium]
MSLSMVRIARIVKSNSHVDYVGRVVDKMDAVAPPSADDYGFAQFVRLPVEGAGEVVGVIYDTQLANPDYGTFGPRLSSHAELAVLSPDYLNEQGVLVGILLVGWREAAGAGDGGRAAASRQGVPRRVIPVGQDVFKMESDEVAEFHRSGGEVRLHYYSQVIAHAGAFAVPLVEAVIEQLEPLCEPAERQRLCVLKKSLSWQRTLGGVRL